MEEVQTVFVSSFFVLSTIVFVRLCALYARKLLCGPSRVSACVCVRIFCECMCACLYALINNADVTSGISDRIYEYH